MVFSVVYGVVWAVGVGVAMNRRYTASLLAQQADRSASELEHARAMVVEQRLRIARELHDMVAHGISTIAVQAAYGGVVAEREPTKARDALAAIESVSRQTLTEMRQLLRVLRDNDPSLGDDDYGSLVPTPTLADINRLVTGAAESGLRLDVIIDGSLAALPAGVETAAYRTVQEAVTNAVKHAGAHRVHALLHCADGRLTVEVTDDGRGCPEEPVMGYGLVGMRERALLFGGTFRAENHPAGGFRVTCTFRLEPGDEKGSQSLLAGTVS
jgi:signal transduction histidine kinase